VDYNVRLQHNRGELLFALILAEATDCFASLAFVLDEAWSCEHLDFDD
jgi:hypothetical protein